jgi:hypothetical protein
MTIRLTPAAFACLGLSLAGFNKYRQKSSNTTTNLERFRGSYGASQENCAAIFEDLQTTNIADARNNGNTKISKIRLCGVNQAGIGGSLLRPLSERKSSMVQYL